jgi:uncharacterized cupin superfamily protein
MRPPNIVHWKDIQEPDDATYPGSDERLSIGSPFARHLALYRLGIHHEVIPPGRRTSYPHTEESEEEFFFVVEGTPDLWLDGVLHRLAPGDGVGFPSGTGQGHTVINNTDTEVRVLVVGEPSRKRYRVHYPLNPERNQALGEHHWHDAPSRALGPHDGRPDAKKA